MQVIPVLDLKDRQVVRGVGGRRDQYRPVSSHIATDAHPATVARAFVERFGFALSYVADLDALSGKSPDWRSYRAILDAGLAIWVDAGLRNAQQARQFLRDAHVELARESATRLEGVLVAMESLESEAELAAILESLDPRRAIFSLDMQSGRPLTRIEAWRALSPCDLADRAIVAGYRRLVVLDLAAVGEGQGPNVTSLCRRIHDRHPDVQLISGGGVRGPEDLRQLRDAGCRARLVASALHNGCLTPRDVV